ncbi:helix-turn-helix domain-containing protein [Acetobacter sacchari]|uniref:Helix-turn-helix domain-containing protein n=1 Tax=Acetobacter sacchari TaxID=2661687 RepID=A0ABS3LYN0_9PROT|nr:XRE family transcriptional regulator [Acetobacter sacchari]MBO1361022.1 helix-turn-helix domain-containing protein [Acetobacter sacchari]
MSSIDIDNSLGARIKYEREIRGWSLTEMAERASVSRAMIHKIERGESSPTANLLGKLSGAFGLTISALIARAEANQNRLLKFADQPVWIDPETGYVRRHISPQSDLPIDLVQVTLPSGKAVPMPQSAFAFLKQLILVTQGELIFVEGDIRHRMTVGDCLELGPPVDCVFVNESSSDCVYLVAVLTSK